MKFLEKFRTAQQQKRLYKQLINHGTPKHVAQKIIEIYEG